MRRIRTTGRPSIALVLAALVVASVAGCAGGGGMRVYFNSQADMTFYEKVVVYPFTNLTGERLAGERITRSFMTELMITERFRVVEPNEFRAALAKIGAEPTPDGQFDPDKLKKAAVELGATGLIRGSVSEYQMLRNTGNNEFPVVAFDSEMIDVASGETVWRASITKKGSNRSFPFGGTRTLGALSQEACREMVDRLKGEVF
jgi:hypothetical protein